MQLRGCCHRRCGIRARLRPARSRAPVVYHPCGQCPFPRTLLRRHTRYCGVTHPQRSHSTRQTSPFIHPSLMSSYPFSNVLPPSKLNFLGLYRQPHYSFRSQGWTSLPCKEHKVTWTSRPPGMITMRSLKTVFTSEPP
jgi:hypothetical protein